MSTVEENVARGIVWLNENLGEDWPDFIDRETFDIDSIRSCILGQTFERQYLGVESTFGDEWVVDNGFLLAFGEYTTTALQREWDNHLDEYELANA